MEYQLAKTLSAHDLADKVEELITNDETPDEHKKILSSHLNGTQKTNTITRPVTIDDPATVSALKNGAFYLTVQAVLTTPQAQEAIVRYIDQNKKAVVEAYSNAEPVDGLQSLADRTMRDTNTMQKIVTFLTLLIREGEENDDEFDNHEQEYFHVFINEVFPFLRTAVHIHRHRFKEQLHPDGLLEKIIHQNAVDISEEELQEISVELDLSEDDDYYDQKIKQELIRRALADEHCHNHTSEFIEFTMDDVHKLSNAMDNPNKRRRVQRPVKEDTQPFHYSIKDIYVLGLLFFLNEYLNVLPASSFFFQTETEIEAFIDVYKAVAPMYKTNGPSISSKNVKTKQRPLPIANNDTFSQALFYSAEERHRQLGTFISNVYETFGLSIDAMCNIPLNKTDLNTLAHLVNKQAKLNDWNEELKEQAYLLGLFLSANTTLMKSHRDDRSEVETIIRMDQAEKDKHRHALEQKDKDIERLQKLVKEKNDGLKTLDALKQKSALLEEKLKWQEEKEDVHQEVNNVDSDTDESVATEAVIERLNRPSVCFIGGDRNWQQRLKEDLPDAVFQLAEESNRSMSHVERADIIIYNTATMNHGLFYRFKNHLKRNSKDPAVIYLNNQASNAERTYQSIARQLINQQRT